MIDKVKPENAARSGSSRNAETRQHGTALRALGWAGVIVAAPFFLWVPLALVTPLPSMIDVFGVVGLRIPASITIAGLLLAAIGFHKF